MFPRKWPLVENNDSLGKIVQVFFHRPLNYTGVWPPCCCSCALSGSIPEPCIQMSPQKDPFPVEIWLQQLRDPLIECKV